MTIEGVLLPGKGKMTVTGNLREVMKESISAAASYVRSRAVDFGVEPPIFDRKDIHVHVPEGATPKDGPSAGIAMATAIVSVMTGIPVRRDVAMTGEVTLRGRVLPIGGLKEKLLAALRGGIKKVLIPEENAKDLVDIPASVKNGMEIVPVARMDQVLQHALVRTPEPIVWDEAMQGKADCRPCRRGQRGHRGALERPIPLFQSPRSKIRGFFLADFLGVFLGECRKMAHSSQFGACASDRFGPHECSLKRRLCVLPPSSLEDIQHEQRRARCGRRRQGGLDAGAGW